MNINDLKLAFKQSFVAGVSNDLSYNFKIDIPNYIISNSFI